MTRKDPRCCLLIPLTSDQLATLQDRAGRGGIADMARRLLETALQEERPLPQHDLQIAFRRLPVQLPKRPLARLRSLAFQTALSPSELAAKLLANALDRDEAL